MASLDWEVSHSDGITLVELAVTAHTDEQVRIESTLEPVWPPRRQGVPVAGWDDTGFEGSVEAERPLVVGYASPAAPEEPPAKLVSSGEDESETTAREVLRTLGDASPPRDVVPTPDSEPDEEQGTSRTIASETDTNCPTANESETNRATADHPAPTGEWFDAVEDRLARAERLSAVTEVEEARDAVADAGGLEQVRTLAARLDADRRRLAEFRERTARVQKRLDSVDVPLATLERVT